MSNHNRERWLRIAEVNKQKLEQEEPAPRLTDEEIRKLRRMLASEAEYHA